MSACWEWAMWLHVTHSRVSPISTSQSVLKRIRAADFSLSAAAGLFRKTNAERVCVCVRVQN